MSAKPRVAFVVSSLLVAWGCGEGRDPIGPGPVAPFEPTQVCHGTYSGTQRAQWFQAIGPTLIGIRGVLFLDDDEVARCLRIGVLDRPAGEAVEQALGALAVPRDAAIIEFSEPAVYTGQ